MNNKRSLVTVVESGLNTGEAKTPPTVTAYENNSVGPMDITSIDFFEGNPRRIRSTEKWIELKESVRARGVLYPIQVARRPSSNRFVVARGGNTRLGVLKELYEETGDVKYKYIPAQEVTYKDEDELFIFHLIENEQRSDMMFWDRAQSYYKLCLRLGMSESTPLRQIEETLHTVGLSMSHVRLSHFLFAVTKLSNLADLAQFLSGSKTIDIRKAHTELAAISRESSIKDAQFNDFWNQQLAEFAANESGVEDLNVSRLLMAVKDAFKARWPAIELAAPKRTNSNKATLSVNSQADGIGQQPIDGAPIPSSEDVLAASTSVVTDTPPTPIAPTIEQRTQTPQNQGIHAIKDLVGQTFQGFSDRAPAPPKNQSREHGAIPLHEMKRCVTELCNYANIDDALIFDDSFPLGFWIEVPELGEPSIEGEIVIDQRSYVARSVWWFLVMLTEQAEREKETLYKLPDDSLFKQCVLDDNQWYDMIMYKVGVYESGCVDNWLRTESEEFVELILDVYKCLRSMK